MSSNWSIIRDMIGSEENWSSLLCQQTVGASETGQEDRIPWSKPLMSTNSSIVGDVMGMKDIWKQTRYVNKQKNIRDRAGERIRGSNHLMSSNCNVIRDRIEDRIPETNPYTYIKRRKCHQGQDTWKQTPFVKKQCSFVKDRRPGSKPLMKHEACLFRWQNVGRPNGYWIAQIIFLLYAVSRAF